MQLLIPPVNYVLQKHTHPQVVHQRVYHVQLIMLDINAKFPFAMALLQTIPMCAPIMVTVSKPTHATAQIVMLETHANTEFVISLHCHLFHNNKLVTQASISTLLFH